MCTHTLCQVAPSALRSRRHRHHLPPLRTITFCKSPIVSSASQLYCFEIFFIPFRTSYVSPLPKTVVLATKSVCSIIHSSSSLCSEVTCDLGSQCPSFSFGLRSPPTYYCCGFKISFPPLFSTFFRVLLFVTRSRHRPDRSSSDGANLVCSLFSSPNSLFHRRRQFIDSATGLRFVKTPAPAFDGSSSPAQLRPVNVLDAPPSALNLRPCLASYLQYPFQCKFLSSTCWNRDP